MSVFWMRMIASLWLAVALLALAPTESYAQKGKKEFEKALEHLRHRRPRAAANELGKCHVADPGVPTCKLEQLELMFSANEYFHEGEVYPVARDAFLELSPDSSPRALLAQVPAFFALSLERLGTRMDLRPYLELAQTRIAGRDEKMTRRVTEALVSLDRRAETMSRWRATHDSIMQALTSAALREEPLPNIDFSKAYAGGLSMKRYPTLVYTVREVVQVDEEEVLVRIDLPHLERVTPGQSGEFIIANRGQKDWSPKAIGRAEVTEAGRDPLVSIRLESRRGQPLEVQVGDIVKLETTPEDPAMGSSFFSLARHRIGFTSHNTKHGSYYDIETVRVADDTIQHYFTYEVMAHDIRAAAAELRSSSEKLPGEYSAKAHRPKYREEHRVIDIMEWAGIKDLSSFFYYVELEKDWLMGKDWPLHELFARWVRTGKIR